MAVSGKNVQEGVGGGVVGLGGVAEHSRRRGEEQELGELEIGGQLVQVPGGVDLGLHRHGQALGVEGLEQAVLEHAGGVNHRAQRVRFGD